jgi:hypothetical protein
MTHGLTFIPPSGQHNQQKPHTSLRIVLLILLLLLQALCGEREFVVALFGEAGQPQHRDSSTGGSEYQPAAAAAAAPTQTAGDALGSAALLDRIFESICRPLKVRGFRLLQKSLQYLF